MCGFETVLFQSRFSVQSFMCAGPTEVQLGIFINYFFELSEQTMVSGHFLC